MLWLALATALQTAPGACLLVSPHSEAVDDAANAAAATLGPDVTRLPADAATATLRASCSRAILALGPAAARRAATLMPDVPLVVVAVPAAAVPEGKKVTALPWEAPAAVVLEALHAAAPAARRLGLVYDAKLSGPFVQGARTAAAPLGITLVEQPVSSLGEAVRAFNRFEKELPVEALWLLADATATARETVFYALELAHWQRIAIVGPSRWYVAHGALLALQPRAAAHGQAAAQLLRQELDGKQPQVRADASLYDLLLNRQVAGQLDLRLPRSLLERAQEILP